MTYSLFHCHSGIGSILDGFSSPKKIIQTAKNLNLNMVSITDHGSLAAHPDFHKEAKKQGVKCALGIEWYITHGLSANKTPESRAFQAHMPMVAKNKEGWKTLLKAVSHSNDPENFYYKPRLGLESGKIDDYTCFGLDHWCADGNLLGISGHSGSLLSQVLWTNPFEDSAQEVKRKIKAAYAKSKGGSPEDHRQYLNDGWLDLACETALRLESIMGKGNFYIELQNEYNPNDKIPLTFQPIEVECLRVVSKETGIPAMCSADPHYATKEEAELQRLMLMNNMKTTIQEVQEKMNSQDDNDLMAFYGSDQFYIHSIEEMQEKFSKEEIENSNKAAESIEDYDIVHDPYVPKVTVSYKVPDSIKVPDKYTKESEKIIYGMCVEFLQDKTPWDSLDWSGKEQRTRQDYWNRINEEMDVIFEFGLADYFLLVWDYCMAADLRPADHSFDWIINQQNGGDIDPIMRGQSRGSVAGSLVSHCMKITGSRMDPLYMDLSFARFINRGRMSKDHISLPDIDLDFTTAGRGWIIDYIKWRYGNQYVAQNITFQKIQGKASIKDIFRITGLDNYFEAANAITQFVPNEGAISDEIQQGKDRTGNDSYGILNWCEDNLPEFVKEVSKYPKEFELAKGIEGVVRSTGIHPAAVIVSPEPLDDIFPMVWDTRSKSKVVGFDYKSSEKLGALKIDILGLSALDKIDYIQRLVNNEA